MTETGSVAWWCLLTDAQGDDLQPDTYAHAWTSIVQTPYDWCWAKGNCLHAAMFSIFSCCKAGYTRTYQYVIVDQLVDIVCITAIIHGVLEGGKVLAMHVEHNVPYPIHPPPPQTQVPLEDTPAAPRKAPVSSCLNICNM